MQRKLSILLSAALLLSTLTACHRLPASSAEDPGDSSPASSSLPSGGSSTGDASIQPVPEPEPEPAPAYDPSYTLDIDYPKVRPGALELPIHNATGYASVQLPLWEEIPEPEPETDPDDPIAPTDPGAQPGESQTPAGSQSGDSSVQEPGDTLQPGDISQPGDTSQPVDSSQTGQAGDTSQPVQPGDSSLPGDTPSQDGQKEDASTSSGLVPAPSSPFLPDFSQGGTSSPSTQLPASSDEDIIYAPGEEPIPDQPEQDPESDPFEGTVAVLEPGTAFIIQEENEEGDWWLVECKEGTGWIENRYCLINLPDVIPSMVYNATNSYDSRFVTLGKKIPNVTGRAFYPRGSYNHRLERNEFMMPVLYPMSKNICQAQQAALAQGNTLVLYEGYRPHEVQSAVYKALAALSRNNPQVKEAVASAPWDISWFIAGGYSNHQRGFAIDVTLAQIQRAELQTIGSHQVLRVREYEEYTMPTPIHELSKAAATFVKPVASHSPTAWKSAQMTETMASNQPALALQRYCTDAGLTPLASEWWHFNDLETRNSVLENLSTGDYKISRCLSSAP